MLLNLNQNWIDLFVGTCLHRLFYRSEFFDGFWWPGCPVLNGHLIVGVTSYSFENVLHCCPFFVEAGILCIYHLGSNGLVRRSIFPG